MKKQHFVFISTFLLLFVSIYSHAFAQSDPPANAGLGCGGGFGPFATFFCQTRTKADVGMKLNTAISSIIGVLTVIAALWFFIQLILAGYMWINAGGDPEQTANAWKKIYNAIIGLIIVVGAWVIVGLVGKLVGLDILNPGNTLQTIGF